ncbi:MAG: DUF898 family protein [Pseudomonadota bacterium]
MRIENTSKFGRMFWIGTYTTLLSIVTLTIFRFWGRTNFRRQLWSDTTIGGEPLEYTGTGKELFIGFFIAIFTLMVPFIGLLVAAQALLADVGLALAVIAIYLVFFWLIGVAVYLARRYHLSRTRFRGIRFAQTGSAVSYGFQYFGWLFATLLTLGWLAPLMRIDLSKKLWEAAYFGSEKFQFLKTPEAKSEQVYTSFALSYLGMIAIYAGWFIFLQVTMGLDQLAEETLFLDPMNVVLFYGSLFAFGFIGAFFYSWHEAVMVRRIVKSIHLQGTPLSSRISMMDILVLTLTNGLIVVFTLGLGIMVAQMRVWKKIANTNSVAGPIDLAAIAQTTEEGPSQGEGLADGLDLVSNF